MFTKIADFTVMVQVSGFEAQIPVRMKVDVQQVFDPVRKGWYVLTPEEWVRQNVIRWLMYTCGISVALMAVERALTVGDTKRRFDILVFNRLGKPLALVECKSPEVAIADATVQQLLSYQSVLAAKYLMVSNGKHSILCTVENRKLEVCDRIIIPNA